MAFARRLGWAVSVVGVIGVVGVAGIVGVAGCGDGDPTAMPDAGPPPICKPGTPPPQPWFTEVTAEVGLGTAAAPRALADCIAAADLDGDGYPDLLTSFGYNAERMPSPQHNLLMNRPDPNDPTRRIFVDEYGASGLSVTRDGDNHRGWGVTGGAFGDLDNDGDVDLLACPGAFFDQKVVDECVAFLNDGAGHFALAPAGDLEAAGVFDMASSGVLTDIDRDGVLDFWPDTFGGPPWLFHGDGGGLYHDVSAAWGLPQQPGADADNASYRITFGVTACDLDGDGDQDVLLADYGRTENWIWRNDGDHFTEVGLALGLAHDDRMDFSDDESYRCWCSLNAGKCDPNLPKPRVPCPPGPGQRAWMPGVTDQAWQLGGNNMTFACADYDNDGDADLMLSTIVHWDVGGSSDPTELIVNQGGKFVRPGNDKTGMARTHVGGWNDGDLQVAFADLDLDGLKDVYMTASDYPGDRGWLWRQKTDHTFEEVAMASGVAQSQPSGLALVDLDRDGDLDLVVGTSTFRNVAPNQAVRVYLNRAAETVNWTQVKLVGLGTGHANVSAIGARVSVTAGGVTQVQEVQGAFGHMGAENDLVLTFGLGASCTVDQIEVRWPDAAGTTQTFTNVGANYRVELREGDSAVRYLTP